MVEANAGSGWRHYAGHFGENKGRKRNKREERVKERYKYHLCLIIILSGCSNQY